MRNVTRQLTLTSMLVALVFLLGFTPVGLISLGVINVTTLCIPVIVGTILLGWKTGVLLGGCFAAVSVYRLFAAPAGLTAPLLERSAILAVVMSVFPRLLLPVSAHFVYRAVARGKENSRFAIPFAAAAGSATNTVLYLGMMVCFYCGLGLNSADFLKTVGGIALGAGTAEAVAAALIAAPVAHAVWLIQGK